MFPKQWDYSASQIIYTDASDIAAGVYYNGQWSVLQFVGNYSWLANRTIAYRELYVAVMAIATFTTQLENKTVTLFIDNQAIQQSINTGTCKEPSIKGLLRSLYYHDYYVSVHHIVYRTCFLTSESNEIADCLSRLRIDKFRQLCPDSVSTMTQPVDIYLDFFKM